MSSEHYVRRNLRCSFPGVDRIARVRRRQDGRRDCTGAGTVRLGGTRQRGRCSPHMVHVNRRARTSRRRRISTREGREARDNKDRGGMIQRVGLARRVATTGGKLRARTDKFKRRTPRTNATRRQGQRHQNTIKRLRRLRRRRVRRDRRRGQLRRKPRRTRRQSLMARLRVNFRRFLRCRCHMIMPLFRTIGGILRGHPVLLIQDV